MVWLSYIDTFFSFSVVVFSTGWGTFGRLTFIIKSYWPLKPKLNLQSIPAYFRYKTPVSVISLHSFVEIACTPFRIQQAVPWLQCHVCGGTCHVGVS